MGPIAVTDRKIGDRVAGLKSVFQPSQQRGDAAETDVLDVVIMKFSEDVSLDFFADSAYLLDRRTVATSQAGDRLLVHGALKEGSKIDEKVIAPAFCLLEFTDAGSSANDPTLRVAVAKFLNPEFSSLTGLSGAPVFNVTQNALCGMVVRATTQTVGRQFSLRYVDLFDMMQVLKAAHEGRGDAYYRKIVPIKCST
jgi:hypothetical protein